MADDALDAIGKKSSKQTLGKASKAGSAASKGWDEDTDWYLRYVALVAENNPRRPEKVAARKDVKAALQEAAAAAGASLKDKVDKAWDDGASLGKTHATRELKHFGLKTPTDNFTDEPEIFREDVERLQKDFVSKSLASLAEGKKITKDKFALRARLITEAALKDAEARSKGHYLSLAGLHVKWVSRLLPTTCSSCKALHGQVVKFGSPFKEPADIGVKVHGGGPLFRPPRHPWCWCYLQAVKK